MDVEFFLLPRVMNFLGLTIRRMLDDHHIIHSHYSPCSTYLTSTKTLYPETSDK